MKITITALPSAKRTALVGIIKLWARVNSVEVTIKEKNERTNHGRKNSVQNPS